MGQAARARPLRADARRNRQRILAIAYEAFAVEGVAVSIDEIARRATVGPGTIHRHFPSKDDLVAAVVLDRVEHLVAHGRKLAKEEEPGRAFVSFFTHMVDEGVANRALADALDGVGFDIDTAVSGAEQDLQGVFTDLLDDAQKAGAIRADIEPADVRALVIGCITAQRHRAVMPSNVVAPVLDGLRAGG